MMDTAIPAILSRAGCVEVACLFAREIVEHNGLDRHSYMVAKIRRRLDLGGYSEDGAYMPIVLPEYAQPLPEDF
ncbi:MAG: hypothetical protein MUC88_20720 [Planctomycetes bacterium]|jgi:hypothetical protein|nr:hypothetical protein [Planctomycetota bacterium]